MLSLPNLEAGMADFYDVIVVGGGAAGLSAAIVLGDAVATYSCAMWGNPGIRRHELYTACLVTKEHPPVTC